MTDACLVEGLILMRASKRAMTLTLNVCAVATEVLILKVIGVFCDETPDRRTPFEDNFSQFTPKMNLDG